jgi:DNA-directed RNA polymerase subunit RPC12/RpoP
MAICDTCGNDYDKAFEVLKDGKRWTFDSLECAAHRLAPACTRCGVRILGHGHEAGGVFYCARHCAELAGAEGLRDRV